MPPNLWLLFTVKLLHLAAMATWIGGAAVAPIGMRAELALGPAAALACVERLRRATVVVASAAVATVLTGAALVQLAGGWQAMPARIKLGVVLTGVIFLIGGAGTRPLLGALRAHFAAGGDGPSAEAIRRRFLLLIAIEMVLRLAVLALMVLPL